MRYPLDPIWSRFPFPYRPITRLHRCGPLWAVDLGRNYLGYTLSIVKVYFVGDTLVDTGPSPFGHRVVALAKEKKIRKALVTHHHEDHSGGAGLLAREGMEILASSLTGSLIEKTFPLPFYRHLGWGKIIPCPKITPLGEEVALGPFDARVIPTPGHAIDQVAFYVPSQGWLFSGDAFIHPRIKYFMDSEDFHQTKLTLERLLTLDFDVLFCQHNPQLKRGKEALQKKLEWFLELEEKTLELRKNGLEVAEIAKKILPTSSTFFKWFTAGQVSSENIVRSILGGTV